MTPSSPETVMCTFRVIEGKEEEFIALLRVHWPALRAVGLVTATPSQVFRGREVSGKSYFVEIFEWRDAAAVRTAHELPEVMAVWEPMGPLCEGRDGKPAMEFPHVEPIQLDR